MNHKYLICVLLVFLPSCATITQTAPAPEELTNLLKRNLVLLPDHEFEHLPSELEENEIIFLGEYKHHVEHLSLAASRLSVYLAYYRPVVYASESCYGFGPFMEAASLGNPKTAKHFYIHKCVRAFNSHQTADKKILMTAIDIEHNIKGPKDNVSIFLRELASRSTNNTASEEINIEIDQLSAQNTHDKVDRYLKRLKKVFQRHLDTFSSEDQAEILFSLDLLQASNRFYKYTSDRGIGRIFLRNLGWDLREKYFTKTIERAYRKAQRRNAILLCRVGAPHAYLADKQGRYFSRVYPPTKGKVASVGLVPLYYDAGGANDDADEQRNDIDSIVKTLMEDDEYSYLSLSDLQKSAGSSLKWSKYYSGSGPKHDGLLFVKVKGKSD